MGLPLATENRIIFVWDFCWKVVYSPEGLMKGAAFQKALLGAQPVLWSVFILASPLASALKRGGKGLGGGR